MHNTSYTSNSGTSQMFGLVIEDLTRTAYVHIETQAERYRRRANEVADFAMECALIGKTTTAEICAEFADELIRIASFVELIDQPLTTATLSIQGKQ